MVERIQSNIVLSFLPMSEISFYLGKISEIENGISIPSVTHIWVKNPAGPLISTGAVSAIYFGQNTEYAPQARPYKKRPILSIVRDK